MINRSTPVAIATAGLTLALVASSIVLHGISVTPLMALYGRRKSRDSAGRTS